MKTEPSFCLGSLQNLTRAGTELVCNEVALSIYISLGLPSFRAQPWGSLPYPHLPFLPTLLDICYSVFISFLLHVEPFIPSAQLGPGSSQLNTELDTQEAGGWRMPSVLHMPPRHTQMGLDKGSIYEKIETKTKAADEQSKTVNDSREVRAPWARASYRQE